MIVRLLDNIRKKQVDDRLYGMYHTVNRCTIVLIQW